MQEKCPVLKYLWPSVIGSLIAYTLEKCQGEEQGRKFFTKKETVLLISRNNEGAQVSEPTGVLHRLLLPLLGIFLLVSLSHYLDSQFLEIRISHCPSIHTASSLRTLVGAP